jgi:hypothetical protein
MSRLSSKVEIVLPIIAASVPILSYVGWAALMKSWVVPHFYPPGTPRLSYGIKWLFLLVLVVVPLEVVGCLSVALALQRGFVAAAVLCWAVGVPAILFLGLVLIDDVARYGYEPTKLVIHPVPARSSAAVLGWGCVMTAAAIYRRVTEKK